jgi:hypothetical protein
VQAAVCRDSKGKIIKAIAQTNPSCEPTYGEALAAQLAASLAAGLKLTKFSLEGDSQIVINALTTPSITVDWHIESVIANALTLIPSSSLWEAKKIHRSANFCAHHVAYWAAARVFSGCIPTYFPPLLPLLYVVVKIHPPLSFCLVVRPLAPLLVECYALLQKKKKNILLFETHLLREKDFYISNSLNFFYLVYFKR